MITFSGVTKSFGGQCLFVNADFQVNPGERIGVIGRNGSGKTTLFNIILGKEGTDQGDIIRPKNHRIACMDQEPVFTCRQVLAEACLGLPCGIRDEIWRAEKILSGLGFSESDVTRPPEEFSGGFQIRINLAKVLLAVPNLLLLDEPTNFLDILSLRWLEKFLKSWEGEIMIISHDRHFMDSICTHTLGIHRNKIRKIRGSSGKLIEQLRSEEGIYEKTRLKEKKKRKQEELFINKFRAKARQAGLVQSRIKSLEKRESLDKLESIQTLEFNFKIKKLDSKNLLAVHQLGFSYENSFSGLIQNLDFNVSAGDKIAVIGPNGRGKSTLLRLLTGKLKPCSGRIKRHPLLTTAHFEQGNTVVLDPARSVYEEILLSDPSQDKQTSRDICGAMMFGGDAALKKISVLSGGEKSRVCLGKLLATPCQLLFLDEPTNHLDPESCEALIQAMKKFPGAVIFVTHNERFLHQVPTRLIVFDSGKQIVFESGYQDFLKEIGWRDEEPSQKPKAAEIQHPSSQKRRLKHLKANLLKEKSRILKGPERIVTSLEKKITVLEGEIQRINEELIIASQEGDSARIAALSTTLRQKKSKSEDLYWELDKATVKFERIQSAFLEKMKKMDLEGF